jgi:radical SAM superfamily enzyme YgiQ (UPF0313 family)
LKNSIFLADLTHTSQGYASELTPYPIACIKSWAHQFSKHSLEIELFKDPQKFINKFLIKKPSIVGFSNYMWNLDISYSIASEIKNNFPKTIIIFGGPNFPLEDNRRKIWLEKYKAVDAYIIGEGEKPFTDFCDMWISTQDILKAVLATSGCHALINDQYIKSDDKSPRVENLDSVPSPYLNGYLDEFLTEVSLTPLLETNRGCPFTCTFCVDGIKDRSKVYRKSIDRFEAELEYIAKRYQGKVLTLADLNFGMYNQDLDVSRVIAKIKKNYSYPQHLQVSTGKNQKERVLDCAEILEGSLRLAASVQTLDQTVLKNIKRDNISTEKLIEVTQRANALDANSYSEVILGLPGDTKDKHFKTVFTLADAGLKFIPLYTLMLLEGSVLGTDEERAKWQMQSGYRVVPRCYGEYNFKDRIILSAEIEEVCIATNSLPYIDYLECRSLALTMGLFYQDRILFELYSFLKILNIKSSELISRLHSKRINLTPGITNLFDSFDKATKEEIWENSNDLEKFVKQDGATIRKYISGELGNNILFRHRALAFLNLIDDIHDAAFKEAIALLKEKGLDHKKWGHYLKQLSIYSASRKKNLFKLNTKYVHKFDYNIDLLFKKNFEILPIKTLKPLTIHFYSSEESTSIIEDQMRVQGSDINGIGKVISRIPVSKLQRQIRFENEAGAFEIAEKNSSPQFAIPTAISTGEFG